MLEQAGLGVGEVRAPVPLPCLSLGSLLPSRLPSAPARGMLPSCAVAPGGWRGGLAGHRAARGVRGRGGHASWASPGGCGAARSGGERRLKRRRRIPQCTRSACCGLSCFRRRKTEGGDATTQAERGRAAAKPGEPRFPLQRATAGRKNPQIPSPADTQGHRWSGKQPQPLPGCSGFRRPRQPRGD